jgi:hypothetical protein
LNTGLCSTCASEGAKGLKRNAGTYLGIPDATYQQKYCGATIQFLHCNEKRGGCKGVFDGFNL